MVNSSRALWQVWKRNKRRGLATWLVDAIYQARNLPEVVAPSATARVDGSHGSRFLPGGAAFSDLPWRLKIASRKAWGFDSLYPHHSSADEEQP